MVALSHRGLWSQVGERNTLGAFQRSFAAGFGAEIDVRDSLGRLVVSHDPAQTDALPLAEVLEQHRRLGPRLPLAFNVKSCGLASMLVRMLEEFAIADYFVFDMAVPDALDYVQRRVPAFTRASEHETEPAFYSLAAGIWLDCFERDWIDAGVVMQHFRAGKRVALVSPELHGRPHEEVWRNWATVPRPALDDLYLCTDHPEAASELFSRPERV